MRRTIVATALAALMGVGCSPAASTVEQSASPAVVQPPAASTADPMPVLPDPARLPPLPAVPFRPSRPIDTVHAVYRFAALHPEVLRYVPCFCGCERNGHRDNEDCFVASRAADGTVSWDAHGLGWGICLDVARDAMQMHSSGASLAQIRSAIEQRYAPSFPTMTPTPPIPAGLERPGGT